MSGAPADRSGAAAPDRASDRASEGVADHGRERIVDRAALDETLRVLTRRLLASRVAGGWWEGHLASSALSTATAVGALLLADRVRHAGEVRRGLTWLVAHQNTDGGWGDTIHSLSNISTTALAWAIGSLAADVGFEVDAATACSPAATAIDTRTTPDAAPALRPASDAAAEDVERPHDDAAADSVQGAIVPPRARTLDEALRAAEQWLRAEAGGLEPDTLKAAIARRYGKDRTFSVPILTVLAIAGKLGDERAAWRRVPQLPFELAACPHQWFQFLRLPVVSYALPALIAIGHARHRRRPTRNPITRLARRATHARTLQKLHAIQPASGGFLEATPLTAFVVMSLVAADEADSPVVARGVTFLRDSMRGDGSWPIDTNLATWVTTLSINALAQAQGQVQGDGDDRHHVSRTTDVSLADGADRGAAARERDDLDRPALLHWLLSQQHRVEHPYTHAAPGGWAWTNLSGGVPDADDTPGALVALAHLRPQLRDRAARERVARAAEAPVPAGRDEPALDRVARDEAARDDAPAHDAADGGATPDRAIVDSAALGVQWLLDLQNRDGGIPTFCRGWGALPFDRSSPDLTAHTLLAWHMWLPSLPAPQQAQVRAATARAITFLARAQRPDGAWVPLWFGNQRAPEEENPTYGTSRVLIALCRHAAGTTNVPVPHMAADLTPLIDRGLAWLIAAQQPDGGWGGAPGVPSSLEETALAVDALSAAALAGARVCATSDGPGVHAWAKGIAWIVQATDHGEQTPASPVGLYFAKLWYDERLYPLIFVTSALGRARRLFGEER